MKFLPSQLVYFLYDKRAQRNFRSLAKFVVVLVVFITIYSVLFHVIMEQEGQSYSWITGFYWTLTVMSTLGFGDITFTSDLGKIFSILVLFSGIVFLLVMLPFTFIQFFYAPFLEAQSKSRVPRDLPEQTTGHLIIIGFDSVALSMVARLRRFNYDYVILVPDVQQGLDLLDQGYKVVVGETDNPETFVRLRITKAAMVVAMSNDMVNTNTIFTIREVAPQVPIVANAEIEASVDILQLAGATHVFQFMRMLGDILSRRILGASTQSNAIGRFGDLIIVEAPVMRTRLVGRTIHDCGLREATGMNVVGIWKRGNITMPHPDMVIGADTVLILAGTEQQLAAYDGFVGHKALSEAPVLILGGGRVGQAAAEALAKRGMDYRIVEKSAKLAGTDEHWILGNASDFETLVEAGINEAPSVLITTHTDELNIYLTIYCRRLRPDIQIISRATQERSISMMHKAGADLVMSYATLASNTIINLLTPGKVLMLTEGLNIFKVKAHSSLVGKTLAESGIRQETGCSVVALGANESLVTNPDPHQPLEKGTEMILVGTVEAEQHFMRRYPG